MYELSPNVFAETTYHHSNPGFVVTPDGVICIDSPLIPAEARAWRQVIAETSHDLPILYVIVTDHHRGHCLGSQWLSENVIAHEQAWRHMRNYSENFKQRVRDSFKRKPEIRSQFDDLRIVVPKVTFVDNMTLVRGGPGRLGASSSEGADREKIIRILHVGGHTPATCLVWLPVDRVLFAGDIVWIDQHPFMTQANSSEWLLALEYIRHLQPTYIVPGHGPLCDLSSLDRLTEYLTFLRQRALDLLLAGRTKQETASLLIPELKPWFPIPPERSPKIESQIRSGIGRVYDEHRRQHLARA